MRERQIDGLILKYFDKNTLTIHESISPVASLMAVTIAWPHFYQTRSAWSVDQGSNKNHSPAYNFAPIVTKFCVMWEGQALPHDTKFGNCRCKIVDSRAFPSWSLIQGLRWSGLIKAEPGVFYPVVLQNWRGAGNRMKFCLVPTQYHKNRALLVMNFVEKHQHPLRFSFIPRHWNIRGNSNCT